nr:hypothetical protein [uncultured Rhodopila sp.]
MTSQQSVSGINCRARFFTAVEHVNGRNDEIGEDFQPGIVEPNASDPIRVGQRLQ